MKAFSREWIDTLAEKLKNDEEYQKAAVGFDAVFQFIVEPEPDRGIAERREVGIVLPTCDETWEGLRDDANYVMSGRYGVYVDVLTGAMGATKAITMRKLKVKGNLANLLKYKRAIDRYVEVLGEVESEFEGDYA
ncbi:MAG: SCP2 sterol-binding domain-containing protein [Actinobacteria bacterium]|nr:SCP2 sterol-binding domain-containing protein [Actinomycetota bacterium]MBU1944847.1 SCP2 sterol-binding domain-containing protein [Actinomycetota bacterium]MBU2687086.1 SCP2 sterol-binding domain-containing protein [Actinomycetota bacterium]